MSARLAPQMPPMDRVRPVVGGQPDTAQVLPLVPPARRPGRAERAGTSDRLKIVRLASGW